jgi:hypothetical protein
VTAAPKILIGRTGRLFFVFTTAMSASVDTVDSVTYAKIVCFPSKCGHAWKAKKN